MEQFTCHRYSRGTMSSCKDDMGRGGGGGGRGGADSTVHGWGGGGQIPRPWMGGGGGGADSTVHGWGGGGGGGLIEHRIDSLLTMQFTPRILFSQWLMAVCVPPWFSNSTPIRLEQLK